MEYLFFLTHFFDFFFFFFSISFTFGSKISAKIANVESFASTFGGKTIKQTIELREQLSAIGSGPNDWCEAMRSYKNSYNHKLPDHAFYDQLAGEFVFSKKMICF